MERKNSIFRQMHNTIQPLLKIHLIDQPIYGNVILVNGMDGSEADFKMVTDYQKWLTTNGAEGYEEIYLEEEEVLSWSKPSCSF